MESSATSWPWSVGTCIESRSFFAVIAALLAVLFGFYLIRKTKNGNLPPGPRGLPLLGSLPFLSSDLHVCFKKLADNYGPVMSLRLGAKLCVVLSSPDAVKEALKDQDLVFANHDAPVVALVSSYGGRDILWAPYGPFWRAVRKVTVRELLSSATINGFSNLRKAEMKRMAEKIKGNAGERVNLRELISIAAINTTMEMLWGCSEAQNEQEREAAQREFLEVADDLIELVGLPNISDFYPALAWLDLQGLERKTRKVSAMLSRILDRIIEERQRKLEAAAVSAENTRRDFLQVLLDLSQNPDPEAPMTMDVIKAILLDLTTAGTDTTTTTLEWAMAELLNDPQKMRSAKEEIAAVVGEGDAVEEAHLPRLRYLDAVVKETLRLHPVLPLLVPHRPSSTCTIAGYRIPEGTKVFINAWAIQRDPRVWEDASEFKPERFLSEAGAMDYSGNTFKFLPFGAGRRICVGLALGERMVMFTLASLLHSVDWALPEGGEEEADLKEKFGLVMKKEKALVAIPTPR